MMSWSFYFFLAGRHVFFLKGSMSSDGGHMWPYETLSGQLCGDTLDDSQKGQSSNYWEITVTNL